MQSLEKKAKKFKKKSKDLVAKMEFITIFTNSNVAMDFLSSITCAFIT